jgi:hypothetical protein
MTFSIYNSVILFDKLIHFSNSVDDYNDNLCKKCQGFNVSDI